MINQTTITRRTATSARAITTVLAAVTGLAISVNALAAGDEQPAAAAQPAKGATSLLPDLSKPTLFVVGYAHLDTQWRWTYVDTIREFIPDTLKNNFALFEKYPDYVFNFSGSRRYQMMQEYYPEDYATLKKYVAAGKWFPCGSSVDENDANVPSAESLVRQVLYGNKFFRKEFGVASDEYMLPDCFGFPAALPSVLAHCGVKQFSTQKLTWNAVVPIPFKVGLWQGLDGHSVVAALDPGAYVGEVKDNLANSDSWLQRINANGAKSGVFADYHYFGTGDQGGAPKEPSVAKVQESARTKGPIKIISGPADALVHAITPAMHDKLPTYKGELELTEHSAGSVTSQAYMKRWNRKNELLADAAEKASTMAWWMGGRSYPADRIENAWYLVLGSQMHDILPGTSVPKAYDYSWNDEVLAGNIFSAVLEDAASSIISGMDTRSAGNGVTLVVYNPLSVEREDVVEAEVSFPGITDSTGVAVKGPDGKMVAAQILGPGKHGIRIAFLAKTPSVGFASFEVTSGAASPADATLKISQDGRTLENAMYVVKLDDHGDVASITDKQNKHELLAGPARLELRYENPRQWPAWNQDWADRQKPARAFAGDTGKVSFKVVENGPARIAVEVTRDAEGSTFTQRIRLAGGGAASRIEFDTDVDWRTRERSLRAAFPLAVSNPTAFYDIQSGAIERGNGQAKQFEYSFHQWFDLTDAKGNYGVTAMCDSKYGCDKPSDSLVRITLLHTPGTQGGYPDQGSQDLGRHHILYALQGHADGWQKAQTFNDAARLNQPLVAFHAPAHEGTLGKSFSLLKVSSPNVSISALKKAEDGNEVIVRLREHTGATVKGVKVSAAGPITAAREVDGQERELAKATVQDGALVTDINAYELRAFAVKLGESGNKLAKVESSPVKLAFDTDVATTKAARTDGAMDDKGRSLPAEQMPKSIVVDDVKFDLGSVDAGQKNAVTCKGQEIQIPAGYDHLSILGASSGDVDAKLQIDGKDVPVHVQDWLGYVGQWDHREWPGDTSDPNYAWGSTDVTGITPGYIKPAEVAWYASHHHTTDSKDKGIAIYQYCYVFKHDLALPAGAKSLKLPNDPRIKILAISAVKSESAHGQTYAAAPLSDTLGDHAMDQPRIVSPTLASAGYADTTVVRVEPGLYWREGSLRVTTDGSEPSSKSPVYSAPLVLHKTTTIKAAILDAAGAPGPVTSSTVTVNDTTAPSLTRVQAAYKTPSLRVYFSEPLDASAADAAHFTLTPAIKVTGAQLSPDQRSVSITLASAPEVDKPYKLVAAGIGDQSPTKNQLKESAVDFTVSGPVFSLPEVSAADRGKQIKDVAGLPVHAKDPWTINMFVRMDKQPDNHTIFAGFGACADKADGNGRYLAKFNSGVHFWSRNRDVGVRAPFELNKWQMITATYDGDVLRLYRDGQKLGERTVRLIDDEPVINIAPKDPWDEKYQFQGDLAGITIWNSALGEEAISVLQASGPKK